MNNMKKIILIISMLINVFLGIVLAYLTFQIYRYKRLQVWIQQNDFIQQFYSDLQDKILIIWIIWLLLFILTLIFFIIEFRKKKVNHIGRM